MDAIFKQLLTEEGIWSDGRYSGYIADAVTFAPREQEYRDAVSWMPEAIVDAHVHCNSPSHVTHLPARVYQHMISTFPGWPLDTTPSSIQ